MPRWTKLGMEAFQNGKRDQAKRYFRYALMEKPEDISAWLWLAETVETEAEKIHCLEQVLKIEPNHALALTALDIVKTRASIAGLPHVSPFNPGTVLQGLDPIPSSLDGSQIPPFLTEQGEENAVITPAKTVTPPSFWRRRETWLTLALCLVALAVTVMIALLIFQGIPK